MKRERQAGGQECKWRRRSPKMQDTANIQSIIINNEQIEEREEISTIATTTTFLTQVT